MSQTDPPNRLTYISRRWRRSFVDRRAKDHRGGETGNTRENTVHVNGGQFRARA